MHSDHSAHSTPGGLVVNEQLQIRLNSRLLVLLLGLLLVLAIVVSNRLLYYLFYTVALLAIFAYIWTRQTARGLSLKRETRSDWVQVGDRLRERFILGNSSRWPILWVETEDKSTLPGYQAGRVETVSSGGGKAWWDAQAICKRRGLYTLGPVQMHTGDPFGVFTATWTDPTTRTFLVYPPIIDLPGLNLPRGMLAGSARSSFRTQQVTTDVSGIREYLPGDSLNRIHWLSTARRDELIVKEFDLEPSGNLWIVLDLDISVQAGADEESTEEYGVSVAASTAFKMLEQNKTVGLIAYGEHEVVLPPDRGRRQLGHILRELAVAKSGGTYPLDHVITQLGGNFGRGMTIIVITPSTDRAWMAAMLSMTRRGLSPAAVVLDAGSFGGPPGAESIVHDLANLGIPAYQVRQGQRFQTIARTAPLQERKVYRVLGTGRVLQEDAKSPPVIALGRE
jgi:uncharacterized protein (DUF58 family)